MESKIDFTKEYGIVLEGGGAKGSYQIGVWKALQEAGIKIKGVAGTSVGALNGALICMQDLKRAEQIWETIDFSDVIAGDDKLLTDLMEKKAKLPEILKGIGDFLKNKGLDITPLRNLIAENVNGDQIRASQIPCFIRTFSLSDRKELEICLNQCSDEEIHNYLVASSYISPIFKNEELMGKRFLDGGYADNVPIDTLLKKGYQDLIVIRIYGIGVTKHVEIPENIHVITIAPEENLGNIMDFTKENCRKNLKLGYEDAQKFIR